MTKKIDGGPAFPATETHEYFGEHGFQGMTLRDYFAGQALAAIIQCEHAKDWGPDHIAGQSYLHADAMIAARDA